jgi:hypothetical protein
MVKEKDKLTLEKAKKMVKKDREEKQVKFMRDTIIRFGDFPIFFIIGFLSFYVSVSTCLWLYANKIHTFNEFFLTGDGSDVISGFVLLGILVFITIASTMFFSLLCYRTQLNLKYKYGYDRPKGLVFRIFKKKESEK